MILDTSALLVLLLQEAEADEFAEIISKSERNAISVASVLECSIITEKRFGPAGTQELDNLLFEIDAEQAPMDQRQLHYARVAYRIYGKGNHVASLNYGDCFSYALAKARGESLLYKGQDFLKTDIQGARKTSEN